MPPGCDGEQIPSKSPGKPGNHASSPATIMMKRLMTLIVTMMAASAIAYDRDAVINTASELRDWCKAESEAALIAKGDSPFNWTARYWDQGNTLMVKGQWRLSGSNVAVECSVARGTQARFATMSARESTQDSPE